MNLLRRVSTSATVASILVSLALPNVRAVTIDWVTVGDAGNTADTAGDPNPAGAVADSFRIMRYEFTNQQYADFLNAVDPNGTNPNSVYSSDMSSDPRGGITNTGTTAGSIYAVKTNMGDKPVNYVSWFDAARVANWLQNGQGSGSTETGAYTLNGATSGTAPAVNSGASYFLPTENQWYKTAYYKGGSTNAGYWVYPTQSDSDPAPVTAGPTGIGSAGSTGNSANYSGADWNGQVGGNVTTVGTNGGPSAYGTFDMGGNVFEWNDLTGDASSQRGVRGSNWTGIGGAFNMDSSSRNTWPVADEDNFIGFRLASQVAVPEPSTLALAAAGLACSGFSMWRRRKRA